MDIHEVASYASLCGFGQGDKEKTKIATAIAMAESGGNAKAHNYNPSTGDDSYGLWQINMLGNLGPSRRQQLGISSNDELYDPCKNAKAMSAISSNGSNWSPWTTYTNGKYKSYLDSAAKAANSVTGSASDLPLSERLGDTLSINPLDAFSQLVEPFAQISQGVLDGFLWLGNPKNWTRVLQVGGGAVLAIVAISIIAKPAAEDIRKLAP